MLISYGISNEDLVLYLSVGLAISEALALIPALKANSIVGFAANALSGLIKIFKK